MTTGLSRAPFNELASLLERVDKGALEQRLAVFPDYQSEVRRGPSAGSERGTVAEVRCRAKFSLVLIEGITAYCDKRTAEMLNVIRYVSRTKLVLLMLGGISGASLLSAMGFARSDVEQWSSISTALLSIANLIAERLGAKFSTNEAKKAADLRAEGLELALLGRKLESAIGDAMVIDHAANVMEECNAKALALSKRVELLGI